MSRCQLRISQVTPALGRKVNRLLTEPLRAKLGDVGRRDEIRELHDAKDASTQVLTVATASGSLPVDAECLAQHWLPIRAALRPDGLLVALRDIKPHELRDAFMQETVARLSGADQLLQVSRADLLKPVTGPQPAGLVFHVARCGSTLVSQTLKQFDGVTVYAEPLPFNEVLLPPHAGSRAEMVGALRALGAALARHAGGPFIIKFSSWNTLFCDLLVEAFPATPWALCLRNPAEVAVSLLRETPGWLRRIGTAGAEIGPRCGSRKRRREAARNIWRGFTGPFAMLPIGWIGSSGF